MSRLYIYVVDRDFGFAPNPFHGFCSLATCKPIIRRTAKEGDWIVGVGGTRLNATGRCLFAMQVTKKITFDEYWSNDLYKDKKPIRNGSKKTIVGDNIYHQRDGTWHQLDSHHSYADGTPNPSNIENDTQTNAVLISNYFYYFGAEAPEIPTPILESLGYHNGRNHRVFELQECQTLIAFLASNCKLNRLKGDPFDFDRAGARYSQDNNKVSF